MLYIHKKLAYFILYQLYISFIFSFTLFIFLDSFCLSSILKANHKSLYLFGLIIFPLVFKLLESYTNLIDLQLFIIYYLKFQVSNFFHFNHFKVENERFNSFLKIQFYFQNYLWKIIETFNFFKLNFILAIHFIHSKLIH